MQFWIKVRTAGALALALAGIASGVPMVGAGVAAAQTSSSTSNTNSPSNLVGVQGNSSQLKSTQSNASTNGSNFATQGSLGSSGLGSQNLSSRALLPYLNAAPEMSGPGSVQWCMARSSCGQAANQCENDCGSNTVANGTQAGDVGDASQGSSTVGDAGESEVPSTATNFAANDCTAVCQSNYSSCSSEASTACSQAQ